MGERVPASESMDLHSVDVTLVTESLPASSGVVELRTCKSKGKRIQQVFLQGFLLDWKADINQFSRLLVVLRISRETWHTEAVYRFQEMVLP